MKKIYMMIAAASVMLAADSCNKENVPTTSSEPMVVNFTASAASTKTVFGEIDTENKKVPVLWEGGENLDICVNEHANAAVQDKIFVEASQDGKTAMWSYDFSKTYGVSTTYKPEAPFTFYAFYPGNQMRAYHNATTGKAHGIKIQSLPSEQTPKENSCDPKAMFLCSISDTYETWPDAVDMPDFKHMTAYGCITLQDIPENETVRKVIITANDGQYLAGTAWYYYADSQEEGKVAGEWDNYSWSASNPSGEAPSETITLITSSKENIWFGCRPTTAMTSLTIGVYTDKGYYEVTKTEAELKGKQFVAGVVAKFTVGGFVKQTKTINYTWATTNCNIAWNTSKTVAYYTPENSPAGLIWDGDVTTQTFSDGDPALTWTAVATVIEGKRGVKGYYVANDSSYKRLKVGGQDYGYINPLVLSAELADYKVKKITVWASSAGTNIHTVTAKVGETVFIDAATLAKSAASVGSTGYEYSGSVDTAVSGEIEIKIESTGTINTFYLYKVLVDFEYGPLN